MLLGKFPRVSLTHAPTPLEEMPRLTKSLGGPRLLIKRDDCTGLAFGGNKTRKLEFLVGDALAQGADTVITAGAVQSNHCRQTAAAAAKLGLRCILVLTPSREKAYTGNILLDEMLKADVRLVDGGEDVQPTFERVIEEVRDAGGNPYLIPIGGSNSIGAMGYVSLVEEMLYQANQRGTVIDYIVSATGSGGTQSGLIVGSLALNTGIRVIGIGVSRSKEESYARISRIAAETVERLGIQCSIASDDIEVHDEYIGEGYGAVTPGMVEAVRMVAETEGIILDPVYTGKAMAGLIDLVRMGRFSSEDTVVFMHTGGTPALFAYADAFQPASD